MTKKEDERRRKKTKKKNVLFCFLSCLSPSHDHDSSCGVLFLLLGSYVLPELGFRTATDILRGASAVCSFRFVS